MWTTQGKKWLQCGKDSTELGTLIGIGGIFAHDRSAAKVMEGASFGPSNNLSLKPKSLDFLY